MNLYLHNRVCKKEEENKENVMMTPVPYQHIRPAIYDRVYSNHTKKRHTSLDHHYKINNIDV